MLCNKHIYSRTPILRMPIIQNTDYPNATLTNVINAHLHSYLEKSLSALDSGLCFSVKAFKFQTNLVTISSMKRKWNVVTIKTGLETIDQLAIGVWVPFLTVRYNIGNVIRLSERIDNPNRPWSHLVRTLVVVLYVKAEANFCTKFLESRKHTKPKKREKTCTVYIHREGCLIKRFLHVSGTAFVYIASPQSGRFGRALTEKNYVTKI